MRALKAQLHILEAHSSFLHLPIFLIIQRDREDSNLYKNSGIQLGEKPETLYRFEQLSHNI